MDSKKIDALVRRFKEGFKNLDEPNNTVLDMMSIIKETVNAVKLDGDYDTEPTTTIIFGFLNWSRRLEGLSSDMSAMATRFINYQIHDYSMPKEYNDE